MILVEDGPRADTAPGTDTAAVLRLAAQQMRDMHLPTGEERHVPAPSWAIEIAVGREPGFSRTVGATDPDHPCGWRPDGIRCERAQVALLRWLTASGELVLRYQFQQDVLDGRTWSLRDSSGSIPSWGIDATHLLHCWWAGLDARSPEDVAAARELAAEAMLAAAMQLTR